jgi:hypothetical protein
MLESETSARIGAIWEAYHANTPGVSSSLLQAGDAERLLSRAAESPSFVLPIRRDGGHFMLFSQFSPRDNMFVLTFLDEYRRNPAAAQPWGSVHLYDEFLVSKAIALLRAEVATERLTKAESAHLLLLYERYYCTSNYDKVWMFNHSGRHFDIGDYLKSCP